MADLERKLIKKIKKGNQQAFRTLYDSYVDYALRTAYAITRNNSDAADIVQETFIKVYRNIDSFDLKRPFKPWFYRILINESRRFLKKRSRAGVTASSDELLDYLHQSQFEVKSYDDLGIALENLPERTRTLLILKYLNAFTEKEIAEMLEMNVSTVKSRLYKARNDLRACLGGAAHEE